MLRANLTHRLINGSVGTVTGFVPATADNIAPAFRHVRSVFGTLEAYVAQQRFQHGVDVALMPLVHFRGEAAPIPIPPVVVAAGGDALTHFYEVTALCVPLVQAYAFTIHKVQGMTLLGDVHIALGKLWRCNHIVYVALSRVRRPEQVLLSGFRASLVAVNPDAVGFDVSAPEAKGFGGAEDAGGCPRCRRRAAPRSVRDAWGAQAAGPGRR
jgi:ATP-dependent DNA helicase PIF1